MEPKKRRRRPKYTLMILSDTMEEEGVKQIYLGSKRVRIAAVVLMILLIADICYCVYNPILMSGVRSVNRSQAAQIKQLMEEKETLELENKELSDKVAILSETINQKVKIEEEEEAELARVSVPSGFPLTGAASIQEPEAQDTQEGDEEAQTEEKEAETEPIMVFKGTAGNMIVASGTGVVTAVEPDMQYGNKVVIDHGNGYQSVYRNQGETRVKVGDEVVRGATLFIISDENTELGYQIMKDEIYINPEDMVEING